MTRSQWVCETIGKVRELKAAARRDDIDEESRKRMLAEADRLKRTLPAFIFQANFQSTPSLKTGRVGAWRKQSATVLNGRCMMDIDHVHNPRQVVDAWPQWVFDPQATAFRMTVMLVYVTPSGHGLKVVFKADPAKGNLIDNQHAMAQVLGVTVDEACKDASRLSFVCREEDIIYINEDIFNYENNHYDRAFGHLYRSNHSAATRRVNNPSDHAAAQTAGQSVALDGVRPSGMDDSECGRNSQDGGGPADQPVRQDGGSRQEQLEPITEESTYHGKSFKEIVEGWLDQYGRPAVGDRHAHLLRMANDLRYLCENDCRRLRQLVRMAAFVGDLEREGRGGEIDRICENACDQRTYLRRPKRVQALLDALGVRDAAVRGHAQADGPDISLYESFWNRLNPLLAAPYDVACQGVSDLNKLGAVFAAGTMFDTLMTRCWYRHFDGTPQRMNPQCYIIGDPAAGKSFAYRLDREIMAVMRAADEPGRQAEERYKREKRERGTSSKAQKGDALTMPEAVIRYIPSRTSNAVFYRRALNAKDTVDGRIEHLHLYTFDSELDSNVTAQSGGSWIGKHDLELKAFHNEMSGVDYANADSVNENIQVFYNTVVTGTPLSLGKKVTLRNVNDGLCSRLAIFRMLSNDFRMIERGDMERNHEQELQMKEWGYFFDRQHGELPIQRLVDHVYQLCEQSAFEAEASSDRVLDYLRKRAVFYATWFTVPRIVARLRGRQDATLADITVEDDDLRFATVIYDAVIYWQDYFFGQMLQDSWENARQMFTQRRQLHYSYNCNQFEKLNKTFTLDDVEQLLGRSRNAAQCQVYRWVTMGWCKKTQRGTYEKGGKEAVA